jgi:hypothetical protein
VRCAITRVAACALAATLLSGYVGSKAYGAKPLSKAQYSKQVSVIGKTFGIDIAPVGASTTVHAAALALAKLQGELPVLDRKLRAITPPAAIKADHARLVKAIGEFGSELGPLIAKLRSGAIKTVSAIPAPKGQRDISNAVAAINKAGYNIG